MRHFLGIDGGGTKTVALLMDETGVERGRGRGGPGNLATGTDASLYQSLHDALHDACRSAGIAPEALRVASVCAAMAGTSLEPRRQAFADLLRQPVMAEVYHIAPDFVAAWWGATHGEPGIVMIAGTGAVAYGQNAEGATCREDGLGFLLGDRGSGFNLGLHALRHTLNQIQAGREDALSRAVCAETGATTQGAILQWLYSGFQPAKVAGITPLVGELAEAGDSAARNYVAMMARHLRHSVRQVRHKLWLPRDVAVYPLGGLWNLGDFFRSEFQDPRWRGDGLFTPEHVPGGRFHIAEPKSDAAYGAALMARHHWQSAPQKDEQAKP